MLILHLLEVRVCEVDIADDIFLALELDEVANIVRVLENISIDQ